MNIRKKIFFMLDKNNVIKNQISEITKANGDDAYADRLKDIAIKDLIEHVNKTVPFYKKLQISHFEDLPIVNKVMMKECFSDFRSNLNLKITKTRHTSGSTGIPFEIIQDSRKSLRIKAEQIYYRSLTGDEIGNRFINLMSPSRIEEAGAFADIKQNVVSLDVTKMDEVTMENLHSILMRERKIAYMMGYASALEKVANYFIEKDYIGNFNLKAIVSYSEMLQNSTMEKLKRIFGCSVYDRYSNEDNGFIAQTDGVSHDFLVNRASFYIEILKMESDEPASENELGRIVITDFYNYAQPFLRYDTGDLGAYSYKIVNGAKRYILTKLAGRISDVVYDIEDRPVSTFAIGCALEVFNKIKQYQLIQTSKCDFTLNIIDPGKNYTQDDYKSALEEVLGKGLNVSLNIVDEIPTLNSGKFHRVICKYSPSKK